jgi:hypothetical protein
VNHCVTVTDAFWASFQSWCLAQGLSNGRGLEKLFNEKQPKGGE